MGLLWSRVGTVSYYSTLDKSLGGLNTHIVSLKEGRNRRRREWAELRSRFLGIFLSVYFCILAYAAWVVQQPAGKYTSKQHAGRIAPVFVAPALAYIVYAAVAQLHAVLDRRADTQIDALQSKLRKTVSELKDSTHFLRTKALLEKYDPDFMPPPPSKEAAPGQGSGAAARRVGAPNRAASAAAGAVTGAGAALSQALGQMWTQAAQSLIADDPALVHMLQQAQQQAKALEKENSRLRQRLGLLGRGASQPEQLEQVQKVPPPDPATRALPPSVADEAWDASEQLPHGEPAAAAAKDGDGASAGSSLGSGSAEGNERGGGVLDDDDIVVVRRT